MSEGTQSWKQAWVDFGNWSEKDLYLRGAIEGILRILEKQGVDAPLVFISPLLNTLSLHWGGILYFTFYIHKGLFNDQITIDFVRGQQDRSKTFLYEWEGKMLIDIVLKKLK